MADPGRLTEKQREFIESMGIFFEHYGMPRLVGRLMGLLMLVERPLTLDDMAQALLVSRASISTNIRIALANGFAVRVGIPGDRRDYYRYSDAAWERRMMLIAEVSKATLLMAEHGLAVLDPDDVSARARLEEMADYCYFSIEEAHTMMERWRARKMLARAKPVAHAAATSTLSRMQPGARADIHGDTGHDDHNDHNDHNSA